MDINNQNPGNESPAQKKKNRTLQFYKFLLNSLKIEISLNEFMRLIKYSNQGEIVLWFISIILFYSGHREYPLVWLHLIHLIRGILGLIISAKLPRSYELLDSIDVNNKAFETQIYNDVMRDAVKERIFPKIKDMKGYLLTYFSLTFVNFMIDVVDFLYIISSMNNEPDKASVTIIFFIIVFLYIVIDLCYVFWSHSLKYTFSHDLMNPINEAFSGVIHKIRDRLKLGKNKQPQEPQVDINVEVENNAGNQRAVNSSQSNQAPNNQIQKNFTINKNEVDLEFKKQATGKENKGYDSIQIDFEAKDQQPQNANNVNNIKGYY